HEQMAKAGKRIFDDLPGQWLQLINLNIDVKVQSHFSLADVFSFNNAMLFQNMPPARSLKRKPRQAHPDAAGYEGRRESRGDSLNRLLRLVTDFRFAVGFVPGHH